MYGVNLQSCAVLGGVVLRREIGLHTSASAIGTVLSYLIWNIPHRTTLPKLLWDFAHVMCSGRACQRWLTLISFGFEASFTFDASLSFLPSFPFDLPSAFISLAASLGLLDSVVTESDVFATSSLTLALSASTTLGAAGASVPVFAWRSEEGDGGVQLLMLYHMS